MPYLSANNFAQMKKILVPTDFSQNATNALVFGLELARKNNAEVILLNAYSIPYSGSTAVIDISDVLKEEAWKELEKQMDMCRAKYQDVKVTPIAAYGAAADVVADAVDAYQIDLIVMGTKGAHGVKGVVFGSVTSATASRAKIPLLAIPEENEYAAPKIIALATDFKINDASNYNVLGGFLSAYMAELDILNVTSDIKALNQDELKNKFSSSLPILTKGIHTFSFIQDGSVEDGIVNHLINRSSDMLVVVAHQYGFFERLVRRSMSRRLTLHANMPLLILRD